MKTPYLTNPEGVFNKDLLETIDINELQNLVIQTRYRLEERISSQSPTTSMFVQITHLAAEAEAANELSIKSHKFQEASNLAFKLAQEYQENNLNTVFELLKNYSYLLEGNKKFSLALYYLNLAKEAKTNNNKPTQYKNYTEALKLLTELKRPSTEWFIYPDMYGIIKDQRKSYLLGEVYYIYPSYCVPVERIISKDQVIAYIKQLSSL